MPVVVEVMLVTTTYWGSTLRALAMDTANTLRAEEKSTLDEVGFRGRDCVMVKILAVLASDAAGVGDALAGAAAGKPLLAAVESVNCLPMR